MALEAKRIKDIGNRDATLLSNGLVRVVIDDKGGMVPEMGASLPTGNLNAHWLPYFRSNSGQDYDIGRHGDFWPAELLYHIAGNFPCLPNFGGECEAEGIRHPAHGVTANETWALQDLKALDDKAVFLKSRLKIRNNIERYPFEFEKYDILLAHHPVHYAVLKIKNRSDKKMRSNAAWHNTVGPPFLESGCLVDACADRFSAPPKGGEFDETARLALGAEFDDLSAAPLRNGRRANLRIVPGMIGFTDFVTGCVSIETDLGWSAIVNPRLKALYLSFFKGLGAIQENEISLRFNNLWMQYGGRGFVPWANHKDGTDTTFCLGAENAIGAFANGLAYALEHPQLMGHPTHFDLEIDEEKVLYYATLFTFCRDVNIQDGIDDVRAEDRKIAVIPRAKGRSMLIDADPGFETIEEMVRQLG